MNEPLDRLQIVRQRIKKTCIAAQRQPDEVSLLAVSKRHPPEKINVLNKLGISKFGESDLYEALPKQRELENLDLQWHFIGAIQSNKTRGIAEHFQWVQSVDRAKVLQRLARQRPVSLGPLNICLQVNIDLEPQKSGASAEEVLQLAVLAEGLGNINLRGLMAIPRLTDNLQQQHDSFGKVRSLFEELKATGHELDTLSMGMSADLEIAITEGSTMVRVGTALMGCRKT